MTKHRDRSFLLRQLCWLSLGLCLVAGLCAQPIKRSMAYVTSLSATCVNTFVGEGQATLPTSASTSSETTGTTEAPPPANPRHLRRCRARPPVKMARWIGSSPSC